MRINWNDKYSTISVYAIIVICISLLFFKFIENWGNTQVFLKTIISTLSPFLLAFLIAYFINPMVVWFEDKIFPKIKLGKLQIKTQKAKRRWSILLSYIIVIGFIVIILAFIIPELIRSLGEIISVLPDVEDIIASITTFVEKYSGNYLSLDLDTVEQFINEYLPATLQQITDIVGTVVPNLLNSIKNFTFGILNVIIGFIIAVYLLGSKETSRDNFKKLIVSIFSNKSAANILYIIKDSHRIFSKFFIGKLIDSLIIGLLCFVILLIAKMPYYLLISVFVGITNMIPYFGPFIGGGVGFFLVLIISPIKALWFALIILALQQFDGNILGPKILGDSTGLSPFWVIFAILVGGKLFGVAGMFLGVPFFAVIKNIIDREISIRYQKKLVAREKSL